MLKFNEELHQYTLDDKVLISVTQLMKKHNLSPKMNDDVEIVKKRIQSKASRGTLIHKEKR